MPVMTGTGSNADGNVGSGVGSGMEAGAGNGGGLAANPKTSPAPVPNLAVDLEDHVATVEARRPPNNTPVRLPGVREFVNTT